MVQSVELLLDERAEADIRTQWQTLATAGFAAGRADHRPHLTLAVASEIRPGTDTTLETVPFEPFELRIGAPLVFGDRRLILVRSVVPSRPLLELHQRVHGVVVGSPGIAPNTEPGRWLPHVTLARRVDTERIGAAIGIAARYPELAAVAIGVRRWDGDRRIDWRIA